MVLCKQCKTEFEPRDERHLYCSKSCGAKFRHDRRKGDIPVRKCVICGQEYKVRGELRRTCGKKPCMAELRRRYKNSINRAMTDGMTVEEVRRYYGLKPVNSGFIECLKCEREFLSEDTRNQRLCRDCNEEAYHYHMSDVYFVRGVK